MGIPLEGRREDIGVGMEVGLASRNATSSTARAYCTGILLGVTSANSAALAGRVSNAKTPGSSLGCWLIGGDRVCACRLAAEAGDSVVAVCDESLRAGRGRVVGS